LATSRKLKPNSVRVSPTFYAPKSKVELNPRIDVLSKIKLAQIFSTVSKRFGHFENHFPNFLAFSEVQIVNGFGYTRHYQNDNVRSVRIAGQARREPHRLVQNKHGNNAS
jgi:hypothetical protein